MIVNRENLTRRLERVFPFNMVEADQITRLAEQSEVVYFKKGDVIYSEGAGAQYLYIVFEGQVEILKEKSHSLLRKNLLQVGDAFGEDVLSERNQRKTSARALEDTLLIRIALPVLTRFIQRNQELRRYFQFLADSYHGLLSIDQDIDLDGETVHYIGQPHKIFLITRAVFFLIFMLLAGCAVQYLSWTGIISTNITMWVFIFLFGSYSCGCFGILPNGRTTSSFSPTGGSSAWIEGSFFMKAVRKPQWTRSSALPARRTSLVGNMDLAISRLRPLPVCCN
jgi:hypothetical protein